MTRKRWISVTAALVTLTVAVAAAVLGCGGDDEANLLEVSDESERRGVDLDKAAPKSEQWQAFPEETNDSMTSSMGGEAGMAPTSPGSPTLPQRQLKVIKTALMEMDVAKGDYANIREDAVAIAYAAGGYVEGESARRDDEGLTYATITLRIPSDKFDEVVSGVSELGEVVSTQVSTNDVSAEYVDLESRLRHLQAEETFYLSLISKAQTIQEMITIREHLDSIQLEKEQVQGRMNFLDQQVGFSTLTLSVDENAPDEDKEGFWNTVGDAFKSFGRGMKKLAVGFFYALPYFVVLAAIAVVVWLLARRHRRKAAPGEPGSAG